MLAFAGASGGRHESINSFGAVLATFSTGCGLSEAQPASIKLASRIIRMGCHMAHDLFDDDALLDLNIRLLLPGGTQDAFVDFGLLIGLLNRPARGFNDRLLAFVFRQPVAKKCAYR